MLDYGWWINMLNLGWFVDWLVDLGFVFVLICWVLILFCCILIFLGVVLVYVWLLFVVVDYLIVYGVVGLVLMMVVLFDWLVYVLFFVVVGGYWCDGCVMVFWWCEILSIWDLGCCMGFGILVGFGGERLVFGFGLVCWCCRCCWKWLCLR